jgi:hypothetical protein
MKIANKASSLLKQHGILKFAWLVFRYILRKALGIDWWTDTLWERSLSDPLTEVIPKIQVKFRQATKNDIDKFKGIIDENILNDFQRRFKKNRICFLALDGEKVTAYSWISLGEYDTIRENDIKFQKETKIKEKDVYLFDIYVVPEYRNNRLQTALDYIRLKYAHDLGYTRAVTTIASTNTYSLKSAQSSGFRLSRTLTYFRIFWLNFYRWRDITNSRRLA